MNWNISHDGRVTRLDNGPKRPWWWKNEPDDASDGDGDGDGIQTGLRNAPDPHPSASPTPATDNDPAADRQ